MTKKACLTGMPGILLAFIMALSGCPNSNSEPSDAWTKVSNVNELAGTWKGTGTINFPAQDIKMGDDGEEDSSVLSLPASSMGIEAVISYAADAPNANTSIKMNMSKILDAALASINTNPKIKGVMALGVAMSVLMDENLSEMQKFTALTALGLSPADVPALMGGDEAAVAAVLAKIKLTKDHIWLMMAKENPTMEKYYYTTTNTISADELLKGGGEVKVNQNGTKLKLTLSKAQFNAGGMSVEKDVELILNKQ
jgi:hypothetical protein